MHLTDLISAILLATASSTRSVSRYGGLRVLNGVDDVHNEFGFVVELNTADLYFAPGNNKICTGTLITDTWVLTAAHCMIPSLSRIRYGDHTLPANSSKALYSKIVKKIQHPNYEEISYSSRNDIGLLLIEKVTLKAYGSISAVDYTAMVGHPVRYAGFGATGGTPKDNVMRPLQIGEAGVKPCNSLTFSPVICLAAQCSNSSQQAGGGDSGGPLFYMGKVAGVCCCREDDWFAYTPVSPYLDWIAHVMSGKH